MNETDEGAVFIERTKTLGKMYVDFEHPPNMQYVTPHVGGANTKGENHESVCIEIENLSKM